MTDLGADELREAERLARDLFHELCPHCEDTPEKPWPIERSTTMRAFIAGYKAHAEKAQKKLRALEVKYNERGAAMQDTGDVVRSLYQGSEVSKRMQGLTLKLERAKAWLEKIADPRKRDHREPDKYTEVGCMIYMAEEALKELE